MQFVFTCDFLNCIYPVLISNILCVIGGLYKHMQATSHQSSTLCIVVTKKLLNMCMSLYISQVYTSGVSVNMDQDEWCTHVRMFVASASFPVANKCSVNDQQSEPSSHRQSLPAGPHYHRGQGSYPGGLFKVNI